MTNVSLGKSNERILVSEIAILAQKWAKIGAQNCGSLRLIIDGSRSRSVSRGRVRGCGCWH